MAKKKTAASDLAVLQSISNADFLAEVSKRAPEFQKLAAETSYDVFTEKGFQALKSIAADAVTRFYSIALLVGAQQIDFFNIKNPLEGLYDTYAMGSGAYLQRNAVKRIKSVSPGWLGADGKGLRNGDSPDQYEVRKPEIEQRYFGLNWNYQNWVTLQDFDLKQGWLTENGIGNITSAIFLMIEEDRANVNYAKFFEVLSGAINSTEYPLRNTQILSVASWTAASPTDNELNSLVELVKDTVETLDITPTNSAFNAADYPNSADASEHVLLIRPGMRSRMEKIFGYAFNPENLQFPLELKTVPNFGGLIPEDSNNEVMQPVYDKNGVCVGYTDGAATINSPATYDETNNKWMVSITLDGSTSTVAVLENPDHWNDPNEKVLAVMLQKGAIFEIMQNEMAVLPARNERGFYTNVWFNQPENGVNFDYYRNIVVFEQPSS